MIWVWVRVFRKLKGQQKMTDPTADTPLVQLPRLPCSISQRCDLLYKTEWSEDLDYEHVSILAEYVDAYSAPPGAKVFEQGGQGQYLCLLVEGQVEVTMADSAGVEKVLASIETGKTFGEMSLIDGEPRSATAVAKVGSKVLTLTQDDFQVLSNEHPRLGAILLTKIAELMSHRLRQTSGMLVEYLEG